MKLNDVEIGSDYCVGSPRASRGCRTTGSRQRVIKIGEMKKSSYNSWETRRRALVQSVDSEGNLRVYGEHTARAGQPVTEVVDAQQILRPWDEEVLQRAEEAAARKARNAREAVHQAGKDEVYDAVVAIYDSLGKARDSYPYDGTKREVDYRCKVNVSSYNEHKVTMSIEAYHALLEAAQAAGVDLTDLI